MLFNGFSEILSTNSGIQWLCILLNIEILYSDILGGNTGQSGMNIEQLADIHLQKSADGIGYDCGLCGKNYRDRYTAQDHLECQHIPSFDRYECEMCGKRHNARKLHLKHKTACQKRAPNNDPSQFLDQGN